MFPLLFKVDASLLSNNYHHLHAFVPQLSQFIKDRFAPNQTQGQIAELFDSYFLKMLAVENPSPNKRFYNALGLILKNQGVINIESDIDTGLSSRQLRRLFEFYVGDSAKTFSKVVRFQNILRAKPSTQSLKANKLFFDVGYYDQAHFIKEFKTFYGVTPSKAFGR